MPEGSRGAGHRSHALVESWWASDGREPRPRPSGHRRLPTTCTRVDRRTKPGVPWPLVVYRPHPLCSRRRRVGGGSSVAIRLSLRKRSWGARPRGKPVDREKPATAHGRPADGYPGGHDLLGPLRAYSVHPAGKGGGHMESAHDLPHTTEASPSPAVDPERANEHVVAAVQAVPDAAKKDVAAAAMRAVPDEGKKDLASAAVEGVSDEGKEDVVAAAVHAAQDGRKKDVAFAAMRAVPDEGKKDVASAAMRAVSDEAKEDVVATAVHAAQDDAKADVVDAAVRTLSAGDQEELGGRLLPDQLVTNRIWLWIVKTFAFVLGGATVALVAAIFVSFFHTVNTALVQILLTVLTTVAGILAGFISGRTSAQTTARR